MNKEQLKAQADETIDLLAGKIDQATQCATDTGRKIKDKTREGVLKATDRVEEAVTAAADRVREKVKK